MIYSNALMRLFGQMGRNPWQQYSMPMEPPQMSGPGMPQIPYGQFRPMPFEGGMQSSGKGFGQMPLGGVPNMGTNALAQMGPFGGGMRRPGMMGIRQRY